MVMVVVVFPNTREQQVRKNLGPGQFVELSLDHPPISGQLVREKYLSFSNHCSFLVSYIIP